jgi:hypothetical protein
MVRRLWWKDLRQFGPIWLCVALFALVNQALVAWFSLPWTSEGGLIVIAFAWTALYAIATGAAAVAGEREAGTLRWLDGLSAPRLTVWASKASFAIASTLLLFAVLAGSGVVLSGSSLLQRVEIRTVVGSFVGDTVAWLAEMIGWGLLFSALLPNALLAAALAIVMTIGFVPILYETFIGPASSMGQVTLLRLPVTLMAAAASLAIFAGGGLRGAPSGPWVRLPRNRRRIRFSMVPAALADADESASRFGWVRTARSLMWKTRREVQAVLWPVALVLLGSIAWWGPGRIQNVDLSLIGLVVVIVLILMGVSVFGADTSGRFHRFLAHHGAQPGLVWTVKQVVWISALLLLAVVAGRAWSIEWNASLLNGISPELLLCGLIGIALAVFVVAELCGMAIRRGITAGLVAVMGSLLVTAPLLGLLIWGLIGPIALVLVPVIGLAVTRAWTGAWLLGRSGWRPFAALGGFVAAGLAVWMVAFVSERAFGLRRPGPMPAALQARVEEARQPVPDSQNAAVLIAPLARAYVAEFDPQLGSRKRSSGFSQEMLQSGVDRLREASRRPSFRPVDLVSDMEVERGYGGSVMWLQGEALKENLAGQSAESWSDIAALFRLARLFGEQAPLSRVMQAQLTEQRAIDTGLHWANNARQTTELLERAAADLDALRPRPPLDLAIAIEEDRALQRLAMPHDRLRSLLATRSTWSLFPVPPDQEWTWAGIVSTPWEVARARRAIRLAGQEWMDITTSIGNGPLVPLHNNRTTELLRSSPAASALFVTVPVHLVLATEKKVETGLRALRIQIAIQKYRLMHEERWPESLDTIESDLPPGSLIDPYTGQRFFYCKPAEWAYAGPNGLHPTNVPRPGDSGFGFNYSRELLLQKEVSESGRLLVSGGSTRWSPQSGKLQNGVQDSPLVFRLEAAARP